MKINRLLLALAVGIGILVVPTAAQAFPDGCRILSPWAAYPASWNPNLMLTNRFLTSDCGLGRTVTDLDVTHVQSAGGVSQCVYARVELFDSNGRSLGAWTTLGPWTWQLVCDEDSPQQLLDHVTVGQKYDVQVSSPLGTSNPVPIWLGQFRD